MKEYYLGLDGGGTKTHVLLYERSSGLLDLYTGGGTNYENMPGGYTDLAVVLKQMFDNLLGKHNVTTKDIKKAALGMAGVDSKAQHKEISQIISGLGFEDFGLYNDAFLGVKAGTSKGVGISCVSGTGFNVVGVNANDEVFQTAGMGSFTYDSGGGYWTAAEAMAYVHGQLFRRFAPSMLTPMVMELLGITSHLDFLEALHEKYFNGDQSEFTLAVCKMVFDVDAHGDAAAKGILQKSGQAYGENILGILDNLHFDETPEIALTGSLFQKYPDSYLIKSLDAFLQDVCGTKFVIKPLDVPSVIGALLWAVGDVPDAERAMLRKRAVELV